MAVGLMSLAAGPAMAQDHFVTQKDSSFVRTKNALPEDDRLIFDADGNSYPYLLEERDYNFKIADKMTGVSTERVQEIKEMLLKRACTLLKQTCDFDVTPGTLKEGLLMAPLEGEEVVTSAKPEDIYLGITGHGMCIRPVASTANYLIYEVAASENRGSGVGAGFSWWSEFVIVMRKPTTWCPSGVLTTKEIFRNGSLPRQLIPLLKRKVVREYGNFGEVTRVPDIYAPVKKGIMFFFDKYEVAPGAAGNAGALLTWAQLKPYMKTAAYNYLVNASASYKLLDDSPLKWY